MKTYCLVKNCIEYGCHSIKVIYCGTSLEEANKLIGEAIDDISYDLCVWVDGKEI